MKDFNSAAPLWGDPADFEEEDIDYEEIYGDE